MYKGMRVTIKVSNQNNTDGVFLMFLVFSCTRVTVTRPEKPLLCDIRIIFIKECE